MSKSLDKRLDALEAKRAVVAETAEEKLALIYDRGNSALDYNDMLSLLLNRIQALEAKLEAQLPGVIDKE